MSQITVDAECGACGGTGIYTGFAEPKGIGVVCLGCNGTGCKKLSYTKFEQRRTRSDVHTVQSSRGRSLATGVGPVPNTGVTYEEFLAGKMP